MNLNVSGHHLEVTSAIRSYVESKIARIRRHFDHVIDAHVILTANKLVQKAEVTLHVRGKDLHCESEQDEPSSHGRLPGVGRLGVRHGQSARTLRTSPGPVKMLISSLRLNPTTASCWIRTAGWGDSNSGPPPQVLPARSRVAAVTCDCS